MDTPEAGLEFLRRPEPPLADDGFSYRVVAALPRRRLTARQASRWTLGIGAATGGFLTAALAPPLELAFDSYTWSGASLASVFAVLFLALVAAPTAWAFFTR